MFRKFCILTPNLASNATISVYIYGLGMLSALHVRHGHQVAGRKVIFITAHIFAD